MVTTGEANTSGSAAQAMQIYQHAQGFSADSHPDERQRLEESIAELRPQLSKADKASLASSSAANNAPNAGDSGKPWWKFW